MAAIQYHPQTHLRHNSPFSSQHLSQGHHSRGLVPKQALDSDSDSDDEPPPALKFSKVTEALLNDRLIPSSPIRYASQQAHRPLRSATVLGATLTTPNRQPGIKILRQSSPSTFGACHPRGTTPPRVVHIGSAQKGSARRTISISGPYPHRDTVRGQNALASAEPNEMITPAPASRSYGSTRARAGSNASQDTHRPGHSSSSRPSSRTGFKASSDPVDARSLAVSLGRVHTNDHAADVLPKYTAPAAIRSRNPTDQLLPPGSQRVKRAAIATGTFLKSGPARRFRRRESDEEVSPADEIKGIVPSQPSSTAALHGEDERLHDHASIVAQRLTSVESLREQQQRIDDQVFRPRSRQDSVQPQQMCRSSNSRPQSRQADIRPALVSHNSDQDRRVNRQVLSSASVIGLEARAPEADAQPLHHEQVSLQQLGSINRSFRHTSNATEDQENMVPPTFKRNREQEMKHQGRSLMPDSKIDVVPSRLAEHTPSVHRPVVERKPLHAVSNNTPHRAAPPPPPKMSVIETATATVGASTTKSRKKRTHTVVNGKLFTQMGRIGKGGSSEVFLVMAENYKTFAMKKVRLDNCDESAVRGFKGEIDLLKKLTDVDRVIRLYDWELNEEKQELVVLMEKGDTDLYRVMTVKNGGHDGKLDLTFTRYYWKEMLECVQAVHDHDIVHSDLKPANFLIVQGRLKLIDFGIANAIEVDHTCNVHRDSHVGTPNYMSPESINDTSGSGSSNARDAQGRPLRKDMKIGKSSDVWSLGCILYQMTYGRPPFAHIPTIPRIIAITNPKHVIEFPDTGIGGVVVPSSLKGVLKRCLQREADLRPTIPQLLGESSEFLHREATGAVMMRQDVLQHIINKVVERCRDTKHGMPAQSEVDQYAADFMIKMRAMAEKV